MRQDLSDSEHASVPSLPNHLALVISSQPYKAETTRILCPLDICVCYENPNSGTVVV